MSIPISNIKTSGENATSQIITTPPNQTKKTDSPDPKSTTTQTKTNTLEYSAAVGTKQPKTDTLELSVAARAKQPKITAQLSAAAGANSKLSGAQLAKQLHQKGQTVAQIAANLGVNVAMVDSYLGITPTPAKSTSNSTPVPQIAEPATTPETSAPKTTTVSSAVTSEKE